MIHYVLLFLAVLVVFTAAPRPAPSAPEAERPNILWISAEDLSPDLGCYGDRYAVSPNLDRFAAQGVRYTRAFVTAPVCAPSRSAIITGMYATSIGTHQMRCQGVPPPEVKCFPEYLRAAGYHCANNAKTDYQFAPPLTAWDENGNRGHWRNRLPSPRGGAGYPPGHPAELGRGRGGRGQPFFAVVNLTVTHESQVRNHTPEMRHRLAALGPGERHDPAKAVLPPYYPDTPVVRRDWAQYHDLITLMDRQVGDLLRELQADGLEEETIVWFWGDHGRGLPRGKRWCYDSGLRAPLIVRVPEKWRAHASRAALRPGSANDDLVSFVDFAPTVLGLAGIPVPRHMQGRPFLGPGAARPREYVFAHRDRMDETYDLIRAVRDKRWKYLRNYMPHLPASQEIDYMEQMPTMQEMRRLHAAGELRDPQLQYFRKTKPVEELYDIEADPHEVNDLAGDPKYRRELERLRSAHRRWMQDTGDVGLIPEPEFDELKRPGGRVAKTAAPQASSMDGPDSKIVALKCATPGASLAYRLGAGDGRWQLYKAPLTLSAGATLRARACRIGYQDSDEVRFPADGPPPAPPAKEPPHWRDRMKGGSLLRDMLALKGLDTETADAAAQYLGALEYREPSLRYWALVGLLRTGPHPRHSFGRAPALLEDPSPAVRIAAARLLCDRGETGRALPVLVAALEHPNDAARHHAAVALEQLGETARPALPALRAAREDTYDYVRRVAGRTVAKLEREK